MRCAACEQELPLGARFCPGCSVPTVGSDSRSPAEISASWITEILEAAGYRVTNDPEAPDQMTARHPGKPAIQFSFAHQPGRAITMLSVHRIRAPGWFQRRGLLAAVNEANGKGWLGCKFTVPKIEPPSHVVAIGHIFLTQQLSVRDVTIAVKEFSNAVVSAITESGLRHWVTDNLGDLSLQSTERRAELRPGMGWLEHENPELAQMIKEYSRSQAILDASTHVEEKAASAKLIKIISSPGFRALCLRDIDTINTLCSMLDLTDALATNPDEAAPAFAQRLSHLIELLSQHAGRQFRPIGTVETVRFLCDCLRKEGHLLIKRRTAADQGAKDCYVICSVPGCDSLEAVVLPHETVNGLDERKLTWRCPKHREAGAVQ